MQAIRYRKFHSETIILDPPHTFIQAKTKDCILRTKERKTSLLHLKIFFLCKVDTYSKLQMQKPFLEMFCSDTVTLPLSNQF